MCFYQGEGWTVAVIQTTEVVSDGIARCAECRRRIGPGQRFERAEMRERKECRQCEDGGDCFEKEDGEWNPGNPECTAGRHDYGERDTVDTCRECEKFLAAIQYVEADEGCAAHESRPAFGELCEALRESGESAVAYIDRARADYPELAQSGYLDLMYFLTHEWDREFEERWDPDDVGPVDELGGEG